MILGEISELVTFRLRDLKAGSSTAGLGLILLSWRELQLQDNRFHPQYVAPEIRGQRDVRSGDLLA